MGAELDRRRVAFVYGEPEDVWPGVVAGGIEVVLAAGAVLQSGLAAGELVNAASCAVHALLCLRILQAVSASSTLAIVC